MSSHLECFEFGFLEHKSINELIRNYSNLWWRRSWQRQQTFLQVPDHSWWESYMKLAATRPSRTDCPAARLQRLSTNNNHINRPPVAPPQQLSTNNKQTARLTVDDDDLHHGKGEEGQRLQRYSDQNSGDNEDQHDDEQAAHDTQTLRNTDRERSETISWELQISTTTTTTSLYWQDQNEWGSGWETKQWKPNNRSSVQSSGTCWQLINDLEWGSQTIKPSLTASTEAGPSESEERPDPFRTSGSCSVWRHCS